MEQEIDKPITMKPQYFDALLSAEIQKIPKKMSFTIGEVAEILNVKTHVLRYWEIEFESLHPRKMPSGRRLYFKKDVEIALLIKKLLYRDRFSLKGARKALVDLKRENRQHKKEFISSEKVLKNIGKIQETISTIQGLLK